VLEALLGCLRTIPLVKVHRNRERPERIAPEGLLILRDGDLGEPEVLLSPLSYVWTHTARVEVLSASANPDAHLDGLLLSLADALVADPSLGGLIDQLEIGAPDFDGASPEGAGDVRSAIVPMRLVYETVNPLL
jgi:hypothetical protein